MAANLTLQYYKAEEVYRKAQTTEEKLIALQEMLRVIPKHKGTDHLQGALRTKIRETRESLLAERKAPQGGRSWKLPHRGAATIVVIGAPNSGKSRLVEELTNASPVVADYPYATHEPCLGMMTFEGVQLQLVDTPPISESYFEPYLNDFVRSADLVLCCMDGSSDDASEQTQVVFDQLKERKTLLSDQSGFDPEDFSVVHVKTHLILTHSADKTAQLRCEFFQLETGLKLPVSFVECSQPATIEHLKGDLFNELQLIRIFTKKPGEKVELTDPFVLKQGGTVADLAEKVHAEIAQSLKHAKVQRGDSKERFTVGGDFELQDHDIVELHY